MLPRFEVVGRLLGLYARPDYLEVGVHYGETFHKLQAGRKVAVDPHFMFDTQAHAAEGAVEFHEVPSDAYFAGLAGRAGSFDVIYLDGLHTFEQTLRDLMNALAVLKPGGVVVIDDVLPDSYDSSLPDLQQVALLRNTAPGLGASWPNNGSWMGDVFKLVFFIETFMPHLSYATVAENHGQTVVWRQARPLPAGALRSVEQVSRMDYRDTITARASFNVMPFDQIVAQVAAATGLHARPAAA